MGRGFGQRACSALAMTLAVIVPGCSEPSATCSGDVCTVQMARENSRVFRLDDRRYVQLRKVTPGAVELSTQGGRRWVGLGQEGIFSTLAVRVVAITPEHVVLEVRRLR
jgi:hypothetical protein